MSYEDKSNEMVFAVLVSGALNVSVASFEDNKVVKEEVVV